MNKALFADIVIALHFLWVLFMLYGFFMTVYALFFASNKRFLDRWLLRSAHLAGIVFTGTLEVTGNYCPLTLLENFLSEGTGYRGSFIAHYLEKLVYPDVNPHILIAGAVIIAVFCLAAFIIRPPAFSNRKPESGNRSRGM
jgi:hypothetical protein